MGLQLTMLFEDNFSTDSLQDPLNPTNWNQSLDASFGALQIAADGPTGGNVCDADVNSGSNGQQFWVGNAPNDCYVQFTLAITFTSGSAANASYRSTANNAHTTGYYCTVAPTQVTVRKGRTGTVLKTITGLTNVQGDTFVFACVGSTQYQLKNGTQIGTFTDSTYTTGGAGTIGLAASWFNANTDVQFSDFQTGSASISSGGGQGNSPLGNVIFDLDSEGFPIAELQTGTDS